MVPPVIDRARRALDRPSQLLRSLGRWSAAHRYLLLSFVFPLAVRTIPEILAGPWPLGFDTVWIYAPFVKDVETKGFVPSVQGVLNVQAAPLVYALLGLVAVATNGAPFAITKAAAPILYGFLGLSLYIFSRRGLGWDREKAVLLVGVSTLYFVPLRFSWDMYKNTLGLGFFLLALSEIGRVSGSRGKASLFAFSILSILASELTTALLAGTALLLLAWTKVADRRWDFGCAAVVAFAVVALLFYGHVIVHPVPAASPLAPFPAQTGFLYNYVTSNEDVYVYPTLLDLYASVGALAGLLFAPILPLAIFGRFWEKRLVTICIVLGVAFGSVLVSPFAAIPAWHRWLYMLVFPGLIFATTGILRLNRSARAVVLAALVLLGATFVAMPDDLALPYYTFSETIRYVPPNLMRNTVGLQDSPDVVAVAGWVNEQHFPNAVMVADIWFDGWARLYVDTMPVYGFIDPVQVDHGNFSGYDHVFMIYWAAGLGGYQAGRLPSGSVQLLSIGRIGLYEIPRGPSPGP